MMLPSDPGPGAAGKPATREYPPGLDLTIRPEGAPFVARFGIGFNWENTPAGKRCVASFHTNTPIGIASQELTPAQFAALLQWCLQSETGGG